MKSPCADALALQQQTAAGKFDQFAAQLVAQRPEFLVGNKFRVGHLLPEFRRIDRGRPVGAEFFAGRWMAVFIGAVR